MKGSGEVRRFFAPVGENDGVEVGEGDSGDCREAEHQRQLSTEAVGRFDDLVVIWHHLFPNKEI